MVPDHENMRGLLCPLRGAPYMEVSVTCSEVEENGRQSLPPESGPLGLWTLLLGGFEEL